MCFGSLVFCFEPSHSGEYVGFPMQIFVRCQDASVMFVVN